MIDCVLPLAEERNGNNEADRAKILIESLVRYATPNLIDQFCIVTEPGAAERVAERLQVSRWKSIHFHCIDEREIIGEPKMAGWSKQQVIKVAMGQRLVRPYLCLDADIICRREFGVNDVIQGGKFVMQYESKQTHRKWWEASSKFLNIPVDWDSRGMGVTPQILHPVVCRDLIAHIEATTGKSWIDALGQTRLRWTEYTMYYLVAQKYNHLDYWYCEGRLSGNNLWRSTPNEVWQAWCLDRNAPGMFSVIQSNTGISPEAVREMLSRRSV
ncbi:hypothetical protein GYB59_03560 [bacterium]|nr:hypothetical protein [bacterium]